MCGNSQKHKGALPIDREPKRASMYSGTEEKSATLKVPEKKIYGSGESMICIFKQNFPKLKDFIGARLSEPHTSMTALHICLCI